MSDSSTQSAEIDALADALFEAFPGIPTPGPSAWSRVWREQAERLLDAGWRIAPPDESPRPLHIEPPKLDYYPPRPPLWRRMVARVTSPA